MVKSNVFVKKGLSKSMPNILRKCIVHGKVAFFHMWSNKPLLLNEEMRAQVVAIVEYGDGSVEECQPCEVQFTDTKYFCYPRLKIDIKRDKNNIINRKLKERSIYENNR
jgi:hypothetical protein